MKISFLIIILVLCVIICCLQAEYIASKNGKYFYEPNSIMANRIAAKNVVKFNDWDSAIAAGYKPFWGVKQPEKKIGLITAVVIQSPHCGLKPDPNMFDVPLISGDVEPVEMFNIDVNSPAKCKAYWHSKSGILTWRLAGDENGTYVINLYSTDGTLAQTNIIAITINKDPNSIANHQIEWVFENGNWKPVYVKN
mgnify:CR=1 FL=1